MNTGSNTDFLLAVESLTVSFDGFKAVDDVSFYVEKDELRVIIGPNGAGKTTVLDLICGKTKASSGSVRFKNQPILGAPEHEIVRKGVGRKFQTPSIYGNLTLFENLEISFPYGRTVWGSLIFNQTKEVKNRIYEVAEKIFLLDHLDTPADSLSHGQKQWLEIGMLLVQNNQLIMLDEPVAGMSAKERDATAVLLNNLSKECAVIIIEHDMDFVAQIAKKVTVLHLGKVLVEGSMKDVQNNEKVKEVYLGH